MDPSKEELPRTVFVRGLHLDTKFVALQARLSAFGEVKSCRVVLDKVSGKSKGVAFVDFATPEAAQKAVDASEVCACEAMRCSAVRCVDPQSCSCAAVHGALHPASC